MDDLLIIGGGPAGIMAAITAAGRGKKVTLIDKNPALGKKILVSGNGKCNISNSDMSLARYAGDKNFLKTVFSCFDNKTLMEFFEKRGVILKTEGFGRVLPITESSATIIDCLLEELVFNKVTVKNGEQVLSLAAKKNSFTIKTGRNVYEARKVLVAAGSCAYPQLGSNNSGYELAGKLGHSVIPLRPAIVPIELFGDWFHKLQGVRVEAELIICGKEEKKTYSGELLFTKYGISGPVTLDASLFIIDSLKNNAEVFINFLPFYREKASAAWDFRPEKPVPAFLSGFVPKKIALNLLPVLGVEISTKCKELNRKERERIINAFSKWPVRIKGSRPYSEAMAAAGGVATAEINAQTMESKKVPGLYFAGEIIDITGESGGYNMQFAFSSGFVAGISV